MTSTESLIVTISDNVLRVCINRPEKRNCLSRNVLAELGQVFADHSTDTSLRAAVLTGAGDKSFAAGGDLKEFVALRSEEDAQGLFRHANEALSAIRRFPVPVIAALNGVALGGGAELALACDFRVAATHAGMGFVQGKLNISTGFGGGTDLIQLVGAHRALGLLINAEIMDAHKARAIGLIDAVAEQEESLDQCVERFLQPLYAHVPQVLRSFKAQALGQRLGLTRAERERNEQAGFVETWVHPDHWAAADRVLARKA
ncbi:MAG TPA: enoyl-CoA hydratase/isomerase family protein [Noviherbaspirillum sp.]|uniref:enoyl-CoA hydratase/isomerase family protein n=1 Tax=Noviherbaspirillum sp. TaxID=1926288 RepID=UPI002B4A6D9B|nr:enoyl-CoA hydratase/isomerase family protein [Noviherbaspirillum sp.]HJV84969.1 enoyl-CoA hydratase/isomerase family protein [Noviherbaspirillum sp.]